MNISFVGSEKEIRFIKKNSPSIKKIYWVPLSLDALFYLDYNKINYINPIKYFKNLDHYKGIKFNKKYLNIIKPDINLKESLVYRYNSILGKFLNSIFLIISILKNLEKKYKIESIIVSGWGENNIATKNRNNLISYICLNLFNKKKYNFKSLSKVNTQVERIKYNFHCNKINLPKKNFVLISNPYYNFKRIIAYFRKKNFNVYYFEFNKLNIIKKLIYKIHGCNPILISKRIINKKKTELKKSKNIIKYQDFNITSLINFQKALAKNEIENIERQNQIIKKVLSNKKPKIIITNLIRGFNGYLIELAKKNKIPSLAIPHGTLSRGRNIYDNYFNDILSQELITKNFSHIACQSKIFLSFLKQRKITKYIRSGNLIFSESKPKKNKYILYAVTQRFFTNNHYHGIETYFEFYQNLKYFNRMAKESHYDFLIKLHPNFSYLKKKLEKKFIYLKFTNRLLDQILPLSKVLISFSSSSIEDSLYSKVPVILFDSNNRYQHFNACKNLDKKNEAMYYVNSLEKLKKCLKTISKSKNIDFGKFIFEGNYKKNIESIFSLLTRKKIKTNS